MSEEKEYYTPFLEDFHIGFEYEERLVMTEKWEPKVFPRGSALMIEDYTAFIEKAPDRFRVKYLDKEDIESLGWKDANIDNIVQDICLEFSRNGFWLNFIRGKRIHIYGIWCFAENKYVQPSTSKTTIQKDLFIGIIKNKLELSRLMKQLEIL